MSMETIDMEFEDDQTFIRVALMAHERGMTLNQFINQVLIQELHKAELQELKDKVKELSVAEHLRKPSEPVKAESTSSTVFAVHDTVWIRDALVEGKYPPNKGHKGKILQVQSDPEGFNYKVGPFWYRADELERLDN